MKTIKRQTWAAWLHVAVWPQGQSPICAGQPTPALSVTQSATAAGVCGLLLYTGCLKK